MIFKNIITTLFITILVCIILLISSLFISSFSKADEYNIVNVDELKINYKSFFPGGSNPLITENGLLNRTLDKELSLTVNTFIFNVFYWNNRIHSLTDKENVPNGIGQFRLVGLESQLGVNLTPWVSLEYYHHSQHLLDYMYPYGHFPVEDAFSLNIFLIRSKKTDTMF